MCKRERPKEYHITDSGFDCTVYLTEETMSKAFLPIINKIAEEHRGCEKMRYILGVSGPPGSGKSTISALFQELLGERGMQCVTLPLDGFHLRNEELRKRSILLGRRTVPLFERKGAKESYDSGKLLFCMNALVNGGALYWPLYSRALHEPVEQGIYIQREKAICIVEGNYLFLNMEPWKSLGRFFDNTVFIVPMMRITKRRLIERKRRGGFSRKNARRHFRRSDLVNIIEVMNHSKNYEYLLKQTGRYSYTLVGPHSR